jgi:hypothetical protein
MAQNGEALYFASDALKADRDFLLEAVAQNGEALYFASDALKADRDFILEAVAQNGGALNFASAALKADPGVVLAAVAQNTAAFQHASPALRADRTLVMQVNLLSVRQLGVRTIQYGLDVAMQYPNLTEAVAVVGVACLLAIYAPTEAFNAMKAVLYSLTGRDSETDDEASNAPGM